MTIDIHKPELAALIQQGMESGTFVDVEDLLIEALKNGSLAKPATSPAHRKTGADLIKAMQAMPHNEIDFEPLRPHQPVRDVTPCHPQKARI